MEDEIKTLTRHIETETIVFDTVKEHLTRKREELLDISSQTEKKREREIAKLETKLEEIKENSDRALEQIEEMTTKIDQNRNERAREEAEEAFEAEKQEALLREKMAMDDASRFIQRKWNWFQTVGKFLAKKKKGRKGKGGKKKKK